MRIIIFTKKIDHDELRELAKESFGDMAKAVVDVERRVMAVGGELHADAEALLLANGSQQRNLWGINIYPEKPKAERIEFSSLINIKPAFGNRSIIINNEEIKFKILEIVSELMD